MLKTLLTATKMAASAATLVAATLATPAHAAAAASAPANWPTKPIRFVVPYPAGVPAGHRGARHRRAPARKPRPAYRRGKQSPARAATSARTTSPSSRRTATPS